MKTERYEKFTIAAVTSDKAYHIELKIGKLWKNIENEYLTYFEPVIEFSKETFTKCLSIMSTLEIIRPQVGMLIWQRVEEEYEVAKITEIALMGNRWFVKTEELLKWRLFEPRNVYQS